MTTTQKQNAHEEIKTATWKLAWALVSLAEAESNPDSEKDKGHAASLRSALFGSIFSREVPDLEGLDVLWLVHSITSGIEAEGVYDELRKVLLADMGRLSAAIEAGESEVPAFCALDFLTKHSASNRAQRARRNSTRRSRRASSCGQSCCSCCHRIRCAPHVQH